MFRKFGIALIVMTFLTASVDGAVNAEHRSTPSLSRSVPAGKKPSPPPTATSPKPKAKPSVTPTSTSTTVLSTSIPPVVTTATSVFSDVLSVSSTTTDLKAACDRVRNVILPGDPAALTSVQIDMARCALHVHKVVFKGVQQQCVTFAYELIRILNPGLYNNVIAAPKPFTAANFLASLASSNRVFPSVASSGQPERPEQLGSRPALVWWSEAGITGGHVGVYIGSGFFIDNVSAAKIAKFESQLSSAQKPQRWAWATSPARQTEVIWSHNGFWPRNGVNNGYSVTRVVGK